MMKQLHKTHISIFRKDNSNNLIKRITIKETDKYGAVYIKFNMYDSKINVTSFNKTNINKRCYMRRNEDFQYQIIEGKDPDINEIIEYIRSTIYRMICDYIRRS